MDAFLLIAIAVIVVLLLLKKHLNGNDSDAASKPAYRRKPALFTPAERSFAGVLDMVLDDRYRLFGKVRVADLIEPQPSRDRRLWQIAFNRISAKHFDFVICDSCDLAPLCVIELDDSSHQKSKRQQRDELLERICSQVALPLVRVPARKGYKRAEVEALLKPLWYLNSIPEEEASALTMSLRADRDDRIGIVERGR
ncbi:hypothetical protein GCM10011348_34920 [Marinobacterium nitratireducens]|uniref:DUF2726 domain-containing protein n=1 Tax=Marinobacterium nitratireducens TaxID=518897 RepID=A0A917ZM07_9GAMM|nr:DUF2726 domain-containing protein [Marinobacterium nitratireducens]GGO85719.1 hypothetical protein GCM10011348_34920 [Marinobacterium nitratireducens]